MQKETKQWSLTTSDWTPLEWHKEGRGRFTAIVQVRYPKIGVHWGTLCKSSFWYKSTGDNQTDTDCMHSYTLAHRHTLNTRSDWMKGKTKQSQIHSNASQPFSSFTQVTFTLLAITLINVISLADLIKHMLIYTRIPSIRSCMTTASYPVISYHVLITVCLHDRSIH